MDHLGVYVQVPFCASKCSFCNFSSRVARRDVYDGYCRVLCEEIECLPELYQSAGVDSGLYRLPADTLYFGGGTPSLLGAARLGRVLDSLRRRIAFISEIEFTLEMTPGSAGAEFLRQARGSGVTRLSIGAQSFADPELRSVGRLHSSDDTRQLIADARALGFRNISLDLVAGLPHQTAASWQATLLSAIALRPEHVSVYLFEIDEKSRLGGEVLRHGTRYHAQFVPDDDFMAEAYETARERLQKEGYLQYEISNFALPGFESEHNLKYWQLKPYIGLGAGAHSFDGQCRWENESAVEVYQSSLACNASPICAVRQLSVSEQVEEFFFLGLRQRAGIKLATARRRWGRQLLGPWTQKVESLERDGWLERINQNVRLADRALLVSNEIFQQFIAA
ncbi:MAG: radical SAM family heme chaperone HemW [Acidobacteria bacterium]|nr:radical SAM family heme chaperone HemW [Acidobacteriota bacterium]